MPDLTELRRLLDEATRLAALLDGEPPVEAAAPRLDAIIGTLPASKPRPAITCADGFTVSVQASWAHYAHDSNGRRPFAHEDTVLPWTLVEVGYPSARPEPWDQWALLADDPSNFECIYGYVPVDMVRRLIQFHGGEA